LAKLFFSGIFKKSLPAAGAIFYFLWLCHTMGGAKENGNTITAG
jgi:hypothetical protein